MIRVAIYARVSTDQQAQEGDSIPAQIDALTRYVNDHGYILAGEYIDTGISGRKADRDELQRLLDDVQAGKIDLILFTKLDRWFRSVRHYTATQELLDKHGVGWTAIWEPIYDTTTPTGRLIINQMQSIAQFEAENTSQRIKAVMEYKITQGEAVTGAVPIGYRIQDKHLVIDPEGAEIVRRVFAEFVATGSISATAKYAAYTLGKDLTKRGVKRMLMNRKYIGDHRGNPNYCPPIVSKEQFDDVQRRLDMNVSCAATHVNIFSGLLHCGVCGVRMNATHQVVGNYHKDLYRCRNYYEYPRRAPRKCTNHYNIKETDIEAYLIDQLPNIAATIIAEEEATPKVDTSKQVAALDRKITRLKELYVAELITMEEYKADRTALEQEKMAFLATAEPPKKDLKAVNDLLVISDLKGFIEGLSAEERRAFWRRIVKEIRVYPDRHLEVDFVC